MNLLLKLSVVIILFHSCAAAPFSSKLEQNPRLYENYYYEDDMRIVLKRNGLIDEAARWPNATVHYVLDERFDKKAEKLIKESMELIQNVSCIRFQHVLNVTNEHVLNITANKVNGCEATAGYVESEQFLNLGAGCILLGTIQHELLHTLGFYHQQNSYDRDNYVRIIEENIEENMLYNFRKYGEDEVTNFGIEYDYDSIMHYGRFAFSKNENATIIPLKANVTIGNKQQLSKSDIAKLNIMYKCRKTM